MLTARRFRLSSSAPAAADALAGLPISVAGEVRLPPPARAPAPPACPPARPHQGTRRRAAAAAAAAEAEAEAEADAGPARISVLEPGPAGPARPGEAAAALCEATAAPAHGPARISVTQASATEAAAAQRAVCVQPDGSSVERRPPPARGPLPPAARIAPRAIL